MTTRQERLEAMGWTVMKFSPEREVVFLPRASEALTVIGPEHCVVRRHKASDGSLSKVTWHKCDVHEKIKLVFV